MRIQFHLRTLFAVVTVAAAACGWLSREVHVVQERKAMRQWIHEHGGLCTATEGSCLCSEEEEPSFVRRWFGDKTVRVVWFVKDISDANAERINATFHGAFLVRGVELPKIEYRSTAFRTN
jgi:hypothetical protein